MVTLQYGSFAALGEWVNVVALTTGCLKRVAEWALRGQLLLDELRREHPGWNTIQQQEWGLFRLEHLFHNATAMQREGARVTHVKAPPLTTNHHSQRNGPRTSFGKNPPGVHRPGCSGAGVLGAIWVGTKHPTLQATGSIHGWTAWRAGPVLDKGWASWCDGDSLVPV